MAVPAFFGRADELSLLKQYWEYAGNGQPQVVNIIADTGVGKTRLVSSLCLIKSLGSIRNAVLGCMNCMKFVLNQG